MSTFEIVSISIKIKMSKEVVPAIRDKYVTYKKLLDERKSVFDSVIDINEVGNNANTLEKKTNLKHDNLPNDVELIVNVKINNYRFFQFKLKCKDLSGVPFFRYDSDGDTHRNYDGVTPLSESSITTPHFHHFNENGVCLAYKTDKMLNEGELKALEDINLCVTYFCQESNIIPDKNDYPTIKINSTEFPFEFSEPDPLLNINF